MLPSSGHLLPNTAVNQEHFQWLAAVIRRHRGQASIVEVNCIDDQSPEQLRQSFIEARSQDYEQLLEELKKKGRSHKPGELARLRRRFQHIVSIDFFNSPLRSRVEGLLANMDGVKVPANSSRKQQQYVNRTWITRPRPGIDRVSSAWLIRKYIDPSASFVFADDANKYSTAVAFDMFHGGGFSHRGDDCTFETLRKEFCVRDKKVAIIAEIIHDADLDDGKYGRSEGIGLDRVLIGWAKLGTPDEELLRRGMELIEGLYQSVG